MYFCNVQHYASTIGSCMSSLHTWWLNMPLVTIYTHYTMRIPHACKSGVYKCHENCDEMIWCYVGYWYVIEDTHWLCDVCFYDTPGTFTLPEKSIIVWNTMHTYIVQLHVNVVVKQQTIGHFQYLDIRCTTRAHKAGNGNWKQVNKNTHTSYPMNIAGSLMHI